VSDICKPPTHHIIGHARTIKTTLLCVEYLRQRHGYPQSDLRGDLINFRFYDPTGGNGYWSSDIFVDVYEGQEFGEELCSAMINSCRAFVAGAGEVWT